MFGLTIGKQLGPRDALKYELFKKGNPKKLAFTQNGHSIAAASVTKMSALIIKTLSIYNFEMGSPMGIRRAPGEPMCMVRVIQRAVQPNAEHTLQQQAVAKARLARLAWEWAGAEDVGNEGNDVEPDVEVLDPDDPDLRESDDEMVPPDAADNCMSDGDAQMTSDDGSEDEVLPEDLAAQVEEFEEALQEDEVQLLCNSIGQMDWPSLESAAESIGLDRLLVIMSGSNSEPTVVYKTHELGLRRLGKTPDWSKAAIPQVEHCRVAYHRLLRSDGTEVDRWQGWYPDGQPSCSAHGAKA